MTARCPHGQAAPSMRKGRRWRWRWRRRRLLLLLLLLLLVQLAVRVAAPLLAGSATARPRKKGSQPLARVVATLPPRISMASSAR